MPISPHLHRKLRDALGADAGDDLVNLLEVAQATRGDIAELRHEMELKFAALEGKFASLEGKFPTLRAELAESIEKSLKEQTRFFFLAWAVQLAAIVGLYAR
jgi:hypothetical protein